MNEQTIGFGFLSVVHPHTSARIEILSEMKDVEICGIWEPEDHRKAKFITERYGIRRYPTPEELLANPSINALIIESWTEQMSDLAVQALEAGKKVLLEKPGANTLTGIRKVVETVDRTGGYLTVGNMTRQSKTYRQLRELYRSGLLGRVTNARFSIAVPAPNVTLEWFNLETDMAGAFFENGCHIIDLILDLFGKPRAVSAFIPKYEDLKHHGHRSEDAAACIFEWEKTVGSLTATWWEATDWFESWELALYGDKGTAIAGIWPERMDVYLRQPAPGWLAGWTHHHESTFTEPWVNPSPKSDWDIGQHRKFYRAELERVIQDVRTGGSAEIPAVSAMQVMETIAALYESNQRRTVVPLA